MIKKVKMMLNTLNLSNNIWKSVIVTLAVGVALALLWILCISGYSMPIGHTVSLSGGDLYPKLGKIREITISGDIDKPIDLYLSIYDGDKLIWENEYTVLKTKGNNTSIQKFEKDSELELGIRKYNVQVRVKGEISRTGHVRFVEYNGSYKKIYFALCILCLISIFILTIFIQCKSMKIEYKYFIIALLCGILFNFVMPPLGVPDEEAHFLEAYEMSSAILGKETKRANYVLLDEKDKNSIIYLHDISSITEWYETFNESHSSGNIQEANIQSTVGSKAPWAYLPAALGISLARILNIHGNLLLLIGRMFNLLFEVCITAIAIHFLPYAKTYVCVLGLFPEVIYLYGSYSYDGINLCLCILIVSYFLHLYMQNEKIRILQLGILLFLLMLMIPIKLIYVFMALLLVLLPAKKLSLNKRQLMIAGICAGIIVILFGIKVLPISIFKNVVGLNSAAGGEENLDTWNTLSYALNHKTNTFYVFLRTIFENTGEYLSNAFGEVIGRGRYDYWDRFMGFPGMRIIIAFMMAIALEDTNENTISLVKRCMIGVITILMYLGVFVSLFFIFTKKSETRIMGIQGRYFLPCFTLIPLMFKNKFYSLHVSKEQVCLYGMTFCNILFVILMFVHYATNYFT